MPTKTPTHVHYWIIEPPKSQFSKGICKLCGEEREFNNRGPTSADVMQGQVSGFQTGGSQFAINDIIYGDSKRGMI